MAEKHQEGSHSVKFYFPVNKDDDRDKLQKNLSKQDESEIRQQLVKAGFEPTHFPNEDFVGIKVTCMGYDSEDSFSLIIEAKFNGRSCCTAAGYGMNRHNLAIRKSWTRHAPD